MKKGLSFDEKDSRLPLGGLISPKKYVLPGEKQPSRVKEKLRALWNIVKTGNRYGMRRLSEDQRRQRFLRSLAIIAALSTAGYGLTVGVRAAARGLDRYSYNSYMRNVEDAQRDEADKYYNMTNDVKMVSYDFGAGRRVSGRGPFAVYHSDLVEDYDINRDGRADLRVRTVVDTDAFGGHGEGDVADEVHGSWEYYAHPMNKLARRISSEEGSIEDLHTGRIVDFAKKKKASNGM